MGRLYRGGVVKGITRSLGSGSSDFGQSTDVGQMQEWMARSSRAPAWWSGGGICFAKIT